MPYVLPPTGFFADVPKLQSVPIVLGRDGTFWPEANRYMDERCNGEWILPGTEDDPPVLTLKSRTNLASRLCAFMYWCADVARVDWRTLEYSADVQEKYQVGLLDGSASQSKRQLQPSTVNQYVDEACLFLQWAAERGYRAPFHVPTRSVRVYSSYGTGSHSYLGLEEAKRAGVLQVLPPDFDRLPLSESVDLWLQEIGVTSPVKALLFEFMVRTGARLSEANQLRVGCFPKKENERGEPEWPDAWRVRGWVPVRLRYGVKGPKVAPASSLSTRVRIVEVPLDLADRISRYLLVVRPTLLSRYHRGVRRSEPRTDRLWLGEHKCQPVSNQMLYSTWTGARSCPSGWHPHAARHYFAVEKIMAATKQHLDFHRLNDATGIPMGWLHGLMAGQIKLILSPLLGHCSDKTSLIYLDCAVHRMARVFGHPALRLNEIIDSGAVA